MPATESKIVTKLRERRRIESDLHRMRAATSPLDYRLRAQQIAALGAQVIPAIVSNLDRADHETVIAMGTVATFLDRDAVVRALRRVMRQPEHCDRGRWAAMTILERFLGEPLNVGLMTKLADPERMATSSLETVLTRGEKEPSILAGFVQDLDRQEPDVVLAVVLALGSSRDPRAIELLRMLAQDVREEIAAESLQALASIHQPRTAKALQSLIPTVAPSLRPLAERLLRKLMFVGVEFHALPEARPEWRVVVSPVDGYGQQSVWFLQESRTAPETRFLSVLLSDWAGAIEAAGHRKVSALALPPRRPIGSVHDVTRVGSSEIMLLLETSFDLGRRMVLEALESNRETQIPVAAALRLYAPWLWGYSGADALPSPRLPADSIHFESHPDDVDHLLGHPAFSAWTSNSGVAPRGIADLVQHPQWDGEPWPMRTAGGSLSGPDAAQVLNRRLMSMSEWLLLAGEETLARLALRSAREILLVGPSEHPLVRELARRNVNLAIDT